MKTTFKSIDQYIAVQTPEVKILLQQLLQTIKKAAPQAEEIISYNMPAFKYRGMLVYFAAYKNHIGLYCIPTRPSEFEAELSGYKQGKGSVQFPLNQPLPLDLIAKMVEWRLQENLQKK